MNETHDYFSVSNIEEKIGFMLARLYYTLPMIPSFHNLIEFYKTYISDITERRIRIEIYIFMSNISIN